MTQTILGIIIRLSCLVFLASAFGPYYGAVSAASVAEVLSRLEKVPDHDRQSFLEAGAKKEGKMVFYSTMTADHGNKILSRFHLRYPFLTPRFYRAGTTALLSKMLMEARAGKDEVDVFNQSEGPTYEMIHAGLTAMYKSPNRKAVREEMMDKEGYWAGMYHIVVVVAYNTGQVGKGEVPKKYEDLLDSRWDSRMGLDTQDADWFHTLLEYWGEERGLAYMRKLAALKSQIRTGHTLEAQLLAAGEFSLSPVLYGYRIAEMMTQGAPVDFVLIDPVVSKLRVVSLAKKAPHPHAGILLVDWILSDEGQTIMAQDLGRGTVSKRLQSKYERLNHPKYLTVRAETLGPMYRKRLGQYQEIFQFK